MTGDVAIKRGITVGRVIVAGGVAEQGQCSSGCVDAACSIVSECTNTGGRVVAAAGVTEKGQRSGGRVVAAGGIAQERSRANGRVLGSLARGLVSLVEKERPRADSSVVAAVRVAEKRKSTITCIRDAGGKVKEGVPSFRCVEVGIAAVWGWDKRSHRRCNNKAGEHKGD